MKFTKEDFLKTFKNQTYVEQLKKVEKKLEAKTDDSTNTTEITIYGIIGDSYWRDSVSAGDIDAILKEAGDNDLIINLNSPGGDAFDGITIYNRLKKHKGKVTINVDGWACSAASVIAMAADELTMGLGSMMMIHEASNIVWGTKTEMRKEADILENLEEGIINIYMTKAKVSRDEIKEKMNEETWFSAQKAVEIGFADKADGIDIEESTATNIALTYEQKQEILGELKGILKTGTKKSNNQEPKEPEQDLFKNNLQRFFSNL